MNLKDFVANLNSLLEDREFEEEKEVNAVCIN